MRHGRDDNNDNIACLHDRDLGCAQYYNGQLLRPEAGREIKVGYVTPVTGPLAAFGEADAYCVTRWQEAVAGGLLCGDGKLHPVTVIARDCQSDSNLAAQVAGDLINNDKVDVICGFDRRHDPPRLRYLRGVGDALRMYRHSVAALVLRRKGNPALGFKWTYLSFWGIEDNLMNSTATWDQIPQTRKSECSGRTAPMALLPRIRSKGGRPS